MTIHKPVLGFIGAGKVGHTLARLWYERDYRVCSVYSRTETHGRALAGKVGAAVAADPLSVIQQADLTVLSVSDDALEIVVEALVVGDFPQGTWGVVHTSGARDLDVLAPLARMGVMVGSLHPVYPVADVEAAVAGLPGATFGVQSDAELLKDWLVELVSALNGRMLDIPAGGKAAYHSAFVFASNYAVTLYALAEQLLLGLGADRVAVDNALNNLMIGTVENLRIQGIPAALTGPLVRGDVKTITAHLEALDRMDENLAELYRQLARASLPLLAARQIDTFFLEQLLNRKQDHASDHS